MTRAFTYQALPMRVRFGAGALASIGDEVRALGLRRVLVLCTPQQKTLADDLVQALGDHAAGIFAEAAMHVPVDVADRAVRLAGELGADGCVAAGGGSTTGLGKAIALRSSIPVICVPTTYAGSEMTPIWGLTEKGQKRTGRDPRVLPASVIYDPTLTASLPVDISVASGLNAIAHAVEALYAPDSSPVISLMAEEGVRALAAALPAVVADPHDIDARTEALYGAWLCGSTLGATTMSLHHQLCHILGGTFDLPHAQTHAVMLPYVAAFNLPASPAAQTAMRRALRTDSPAAALQHASRELGAPTALRELGVRREDLATVAMKAIEKPYANPRPVSLDDLIGLLERAWAGQPVPD